MTIIEKLTAEKMVGHHGGIYHKLQVDFAFNSNHIEGSSLTHDQTRYIFETKTIGVGIDGKGEAVSVNDVIETVNHFKCFDFIIDTYSDVLTEDYIKELHSILKTGVMDSSAIIGDYKKERNFVADMQTTLPCDVSKEMSRLLNRYNHTNMDLYDIAEFHSEYERIHPFYDGNGRTGRLIMFKQCLDNNILPFVIADKDKMFYYLGLKEWQTQNSDERLINVFLAAQDYMEQVLNYFEIEYTRGSSRYKDVVSKHLPLEQNTSVLSDNIGDVKK